MEDKKSWWKSLTIWASSFIVALQAAPAVVAEIDKVVPAELSTNPKVMAGLTIAGAITAIYGRFRAKTAVE